VHCFVLIGDDKGQLQSPCRIEELSRLPKHVIALDPYLDYVGPANTYLQDQHDYLRHFNYQQIIVNDRPTAIHYQNAPIIRENIDTLTAHAACQHFYRHYLTLPLSAFSISELLPCHETALVQFLNDTSGLDFSWGHNDYQVCAYTDVSQKKDFDTAKAIQNRLQAGTFYQGDSQRFFVLHGINAQTELAQRIQTNYRKIS
jgi:hypothetical protein